MQTKIPFTIALAISLASIIILGDLVDTARIAEAQTTAYKITTGITEPILTVQWNDEENTLWALAGSQSVENIAYVYELSGNPLSVQATYNVSSYLNNGAPEDMYCGKTACYITSHDTNGARASGSGAIVRLETVADKGTVSGVLNGSSTYRGFGDIAGRDSTSVGFGGVSLYVETWSLDTTNLRSNIITVGGVGVMGIASELFECGSGVSSSVHCLIWDIQWSGIAGATDNHLIFGLSQTNVNSATGNIINVATGGTSVCTMSLASNDSSLPIRTMPNYSERKVYFSSETLAQDQQWSSMNIDSCVSDTTDPTSAEHGLGTTTDLHDGIVIVPRDTAILRNNVGALRFAELDENYNFGNFTNPVDIVHSNPTSTLKMIYTYSVDDNGQFGAVEDAQLGALIIPLGADEAIAVYQFGGAPLGTDETCSIDTNADGFPDVTYTDVNADGVCDATTTQLIRNSQPLTSSSSNLLCQLGIVPCDPITGELENDDIQTNGVGYVLYLLLLVTFFGIAIAVGGQKKTDSLHIMMYVAIVIGSAGVAVGFEWLDATIFYVSIFIVVALGGVKIAQIAGFTGSKGGD